MTPFRALLWLALAAPAAWQLYAYRTGVMSYGEILHESGDLSVQLLIVTMAATPMRLLAPRAAWAAWLVKRRRDFGVATFGYAALHLAVYAVRKADLARIADEGLAPEILTGWIAMVIFTALAATSNDASMRLLKRGWKALHRWVYPAAVLALAHWVLTAFDPLLAYVHAGVLAALEALRLVLQAQRRNARQSSVT